MEFNEKKEREDLLIKMLIAGDGIVAGLQTDMADKRDKKNLWVSDVVDKDGNQYVNLVQEGGGVLGIALLGYTYVMESMGIRFLKLAGTSAGSINAALMSVVRPKETTTKKTPIVLYYLTQKNLFDFVDGHPIARWLIRNTINYKDHLSRLLNSTIYTLVLAIALMVLGSLLMWQTNSIFGLIAGILVSYGISLVIFKWVSNGVVALYLKSRFFIWVLGLVTAALLGVHLLTVIPNQYYCRYQTVLTTIIICGLIVSSFILPYRYKYLEFLQNIVAIILTAVLVDQLLNSYAGCQLTYQYPFIVRDKYPATPYQYLSVAGISLFALFTLLLGTLSFFLLSRFNKSQFSINPGNSFKEWIDDLMQNGDVNISLDLGETRVEIVNPKNNVSTIRDLENKLKKIPELIYKPDPRFPIDDKNHLAGLDTYTPDKDEPPLALITTEIVTENKIIFPKMWRLFYFDKDHAKPSDFVRASMSIPFFFEAFRVPNIPRRAEREKEWMQYLSYNGNEIAEAVFIDGGSISNFPINVFNPTKAATPRLPTFGARLDDSIAENSRSINSLGGYAGSIINSMRANYDKDFLINHPQYEDCIANIDVRGFNWLDFNMSSENQINLFTKGAQAAADFLLKFDWGLFKAKQEALNLGVLPAEIRIARNLEEVEELITQIKNTRGL